MEKLVVFIIIFVISQLVNLFSKSGKVDPAPAPRQAGPPKPGRAAKPQQPQPTRSRPASSRAGQPAPASRSGDSQAQPAARRSLESSANRPTGAAVREHVNNHLEPRIASGVQQHIDQHVQQHIGSNQTAATALQPDESAAQTNISIRKLLKEPGGVRQAILVNEILARPRALRR
jgi:hypothetical protein